VSESSLTFSVAVKHGIFVSMHRCAVKEWVQMCSGVHTQSV